MPSPVAWMLSLSLLAADAPARPPEPKPGEALRTAGLVQLGVGGFALVVGGVLEHQRRVETCAGISSDHCTALAARDGALLGIASALAIGGAVLFGLGQARITRARRLAARISLAPALARGGGGVRIAIRF